MFCYDNNLLQGGSDRPLLPVLAWHVKTRKTQGCQPTWLPSIAKRFDQCFPS
jgi:hypothetical protein